MLNEYADKTSADIAKKYGGYNISHKLYFYDVNVKTYSIINLTEV